MNHYAAYIRVSTARQGERGVSLQEQRDAITRFAERHHLEISRWFEERETAAKRGRPIFNEMLKILRRGKTAGVLIHKIDRSARNMKDWAELGELIDQGLEVHFVNESLDLASRGGRLSADIQAVVAADYIRNLREESKKGFYGRIKQGFYPLPAPVGYRDMGKARAKEFDPIRAPLVRKAFLTYASGTKNLKDLAEELYQAGLRNRRGGRVSLNGLSTMLNNPFYIGLIRLVKTGETFPGGHEPLITKSLFDRVQLVLRGKIAARTQVHEFAFRRMITCAHCDYALIGETQKGHAYYRCHTKGCVTKSIREETIDAAAAKLLAPLNFNADQKAVVKDLYHELRATSEKQRETELDAIRMQISQIRERMGRVTDAYLDHVIDKDVFEERRASLLMKQKSLEEISKQSHSMVMDRLGKFLELAGAAHFLYSKALSEEKRTLLDALTSNRTADGKNVVMTLAAPFGEVAECLNSSNGRAYRDRHRTLEGLLQRLVIWFEANLPASFEAL
jgi:DNA invertase Pin-like site-specific DNA recombinase